MLMVLRGRRTRTDVRVIAGRLASKMLSKILGRGAGWRSTARINSRGRRHKSALSWTISFF